MISKKLIISTAIALPLLAGFAMANPAHANENTSCNIDVDLQGTVSRNHATVTNYSSSCDYDATLAIYDSPQAEGSYGWIDAQNLINAKTVNVKAGETVEITVDGDGPSCLNQADLVRESKAWEKPYYVFAMDTDVYSDSSCEQKITPTCTLTPTATPTPTNGPTATPTPGTGSTATPTNQPGVSSFAGTGNSLMIYLLILSGAASLITGMILKKFSK